MTKIIYYLFSLNVLISCNSSHPVEKLTGLSLGAPIDEQVKRLKGENIIHESEEKDYIIYKGIRGNITYLIYTKDSIKLLKRITLNFENPLIEGRLKYTFITPTDVENLISYFTSEYGHVDVDLKSNRETTSADRNWDKGLTTIHFGLSTYIYFGQGIWLSSMSFGFKESIENELNKYENIAINKYDISQERVAQHNRISGSQLQNNNDSMVIDPHIVSSDQKKNISNKNDKNKSNYNFVLDSLTHFTSSEELTNFFGATNVELSSNIGEGGNEEYTSILYPDIAERRVCFYWKDKSYTGLKYISLKANYTNSNSPNASEWKTKDGIMIKMSLNQLTRLNKMPITFYGFGWDDGGVIISNNNGLISAANNRIQLGCNIVPSSLQEQFNVKFIGDDKKIQSTDPDIMKLKLDIFVTSITIFK